MVILAFEVFIEEGEDTGSYRFAFCLGSGGRVARLRWVVNQGAMIGKTRMRGVLNLKPECILGCLGEKDLGSRQPTAFEGLVDGEKRP